MRIEAPSADVLVTGGTGFVGGHLVRRLLATGRRVRLLVRAPNALSGELSRQCEVIRGDLSDGNLLLAAVSGVQTVFHCAANVRTWDSWDAYHAANVDGVEKLLQAIASINPGLSRLVHVSTVDVYGFPPAPCNELAALSGAGFGYGESKLRGENLVRQFCEGKSIPFTILRPANVIGPGSQFVARIGEALTSGLMLTIDGGQANAGLVYVDNLVDYLVWAAEAENARSEIYNVRDAYDVSWAEFIDVLRGSVKGKGNIVNLPFGFANRLAQSVEGCYRLFSLPGEPFLHRLLVSVFGRTCGHDAEKIRKHSGLSGQVGFSEGMERSIAWFLERKTKH